MFIVSTYDVAHQGAEIIHKEFCQLADAVDYYRHLLNLCGDVPMLYTDSGDIIYGLGEEVEGY